MCIAPIQIVEGLRGERSTKGIPMLYPTLAIILVTLVGLQVAAAILVDSDPSLPLRLSED